MQPPMERTVLPVGSLAAGLWEEDCVTRWIVTGTVSEKDGKMMIAADSLKMVKK